MKIDNHAALLTSVILCVACKQNPAPQTTGDSTQQTSHLASPFVIRKLQALGTGTVQFSLSINGSDLLLEQTADNQQTLVQLSESEFNQPVNDLRISFFFNSNTGSSYPLASASHTIPKPAAGDRVELTGLFYRYADTDNDGLYNVHELAIDPVDVDNDMVENVIDTDSDGDGIADGDDPDPYDMGMANQSENPLDFELEYPDNTTAIIRITQITGMDEEVLHLVNTLGKTTLAVPPLWPAPVQQNDYRSTRWGAYALGRSSQSLCPDLRIAIDTSSLKSSLSAQALLYFRRSDSAPSILPVRTNEIPHLDTFQDVELDDGLRIILVPEFTTGWIELWSQRNYTGDACRLNLSTSFAD